MGVIPATLGNLMATYKFGRFIARNKTLLVGMAASLAIVAWVAHLAISAIADTDSKRPFPTATTAVARPPNPLILKCTDGIGPILSEAQTAMKRKDAKAAFTILNPCTQFMTDPAALALHKAAMIVVTRETEIANAKAERLRKIEQQKQDRAAKAAKRKEGVSVGMSQQDALDSMWGKPRKVNRTTTSMHTREQWVYDGGYLYFTDGVLTSIQN